jgi:hypothetical protein
MRLPDALLAGRGYDHDKYGRLLRIRGIKTDDRPPTRANRLLVLTASSHRTAHVACSILCCERPSQPLRTRCLRITSGAGNAAADP